MCDDVYVCDNDVYVCMMMCLYVCDVMICICGCW